MCYAVVIEKAEKIMRLQGIREDGLSIPELFSQVEYIEVVV